MLSFPYPNKIIPRRYPMSTQTQFHTASRFSAKTLTMCAIFTALVAVCSQITIPLPIIPINLALFAVYLAGALLGPWRGALSPRRLGQPRRQYRRLCRRLYLCRPFHRSAGRKMGGSLLAALRRDGRRLCRLLLLRYPVVLRSFRHPLLRQLFRLRRPVPAL